MRLVLEATPLIGRWSLSEPSSRDRAAWPPSADTLFSALTAATADQSWGEPTPPADVTASRLGQALVWLEGLGPPEIAAPTAPGRVEGMTWFVPVGDHAGLDQARIRKARPHNSIGADSPVAWAWRVDREQAVRWLPRLDEIAAAVTHIGSSRGPVLVTARLVEDSAWQPSLVPVAGGRIGLRQVFPGRLADLERAYRAGERPRPGPVLAYDSPLAVPVAGVWGEVVVLRKRTGLTLGLERAVDIAEAVRNALLAHLGDDAPEILSGHGEGGEPSHRPHLAIVPMARVGDSYADGRVMGIGLVAPAGIDDPTWIILMSAVGRWMASGGRLVIGGRTVWVLELAIDEHRLTLDAARYRRQAREWLSVSPVAFDRHPKGSGDHGLQAVVGAMCRRAGLPVPIRVRAGTWPGLHGAPASRDYGLGTRGYLPRSYIAHLELAWDRPVPGPILLGAGRHFGLGLMLPRDAGAGPAFAN